MSKTDDQPQIVKRNVGERVDILCSFDPTTVKELGNGIFEATVTTPESDRTNENIVTSGVDAESWTKTGMPVLYGHDYSGLPIGKGLSWKQMKNKFTSRFQLAVDEYPFAATVAAMIKGGYLNAVSIGGLVKKWSEDYRTIEQMEMVEFSVVPIPANPSALITSRALEEVTGKSVDQIKIEFRDFNRKILLDKVSDMPQDELNDAIKTLKNLLATLEESARAYSKPEPANTELRRIKHITLRDSAKAVATQSQRVITTIKLKRIEGNSDE